MTETETETEIDTGANSEGGTAAETIAKNEGSGAETAPSKVAVEPVANSGAPQKEKNKNKRKREKNAEGEEKKDKKDKKDKANKTDKEPAATNEELLQEAVNLGKKIMDSGGRGAILIAAAYLDEQLKALLSAHFVNGVGLGLFSGAGPVASFSQRQKIALVCGLITKVEYHRIDSIREIRNAYAHQIFEASPEGKKVKGKLQSLTEACPKYVRDMLGSTPATSEFDLLVPAILNAIWLGASFRGRSNDTKRAVEPKFEDVFKRLEPLLKEFRPPRADAPENEIFTEIRRATEVLEKDSVATQDSINEPGNDGD